MKKWSSERRVRGEGTQDDWEEREGRFANLRVAVQGLGFELQSETQREEGLGERSGHGHRTGPADYGACSAGSSPCWRRSGRRWRGRQATIARGFVYGVAHPPIWRAAVHLQAFHRVSSSIPCILPFLLLIEVDSMSIVGYHGTIILK